MTDLVPSRAQVNFVTGEVLDLERADTTDLGRYLNEIRDHEFNLRLLKRAVSDELLRRMDQRAADGEDHPWTIHLPGGIKVAGTSPQPGEEFDELALREDLLQLVDQGVLGAGAVDKAVEPIITYKARAAGIRALRKLGGVVAETIDRHARNVERARYVKVERA